MNSKHENITPVILLLSFFLAGAVHTPGDPAGMSREERFRQTRALAELGRKMFFDTSLSASGRMSCATCHDPAFAYASPNGLAVQPGGKDGKQPGRRAVPSLRYLQAIPQFTEHYFDSDDHGDGSVDNGPTGGLTWDGRVDRGREQARMPLLSSYEMANESRAAAVARIRKAAYAEDLKRLIGAARFRYSDAVFETALEALEAFEQDYREFYPYSSKFDAFLDKNAELSEQEKRGLQLFADPAKGNCAQCHIATRGANGTPPQFTDYGLIALGVPRNREIPANKNPDYYDLGMCGPERLDFQTRAEYCGRFMTPSLRNVATRHAFFHNGVVHTLKEAVEFYVERDSKPEKWYPPGRKYDDLPAAYHANVETDAPFGPKAALSPADVQDVVAFLQTLTDGWKSASRKPQASVPRIE